MDDGCDIAENYKKKRNFSITKHCRKHQIKIGTCTLRIGLSNALSGQQVC